MEWWKSDNEAWSQGCSSGGCVMATRDAGTVWWLRRRGSAALAKWDGRSWWFGVKMLICLLGRWRLQGAMALGMKGPTSGRFSFVVWEIKCGQLIIILLQC